MMRSLIVGMGIGTLYQSVLSTLEHDIVTVDLDVDKNPDFTNIQDAIDEYKHFDTVHICTPNFTHEELAIQLAPYSDIIFIEKPGVRSKDIWLNLIQSFPNTRIMMVKNNMWRDNIPTLQETAQTSKRVNIEWLRKNCIPNPGSWFTTRSLAFGGVSRDLMPHLLSLYVALNPNWKTDNLNGRAALQSWVLDDIDSTEYGSVFPEGTYDVDDQCNIHFGNKWDLRANWRTMGVERSAITFISQNNEHSTFELGWCPEEAYLNMIKDAIKNLNNDDFWQTQTDIDLWIHENIENL